MVANSHCRGRGLSPPQLRRKRPLQVFYYALPFDCVCEHVPWPPRPRFMGAVKPGLVERRVELADVFFVLRKSQTFGPPPRCCDISRLGQRR